MANKVKSTNNKISVRLVIVIVMFGSAIFTLGYTMINNFNSINDLKKKLVSLEEKEEVLSEREDSLRADVKRLSDSSYVARYAREKYFYSREGELILRFEEDN